jgi:hypothetical protein
MEVSTSYAEMFPGIEKQMDFKLQNEVVLKALYNRVFD